MTGKFFKHTLNFSRPAGTSRGVMLDRDVWFLVVRDDEGTQKGIGEIAPLKCLSCDDVTGFEAKIAEVCNDMSRYQYWIDEGLNDFPSIRFGLETAIRDYNTEGSKILFPSIFLEGKKGIPINGLVWMGDAGFMKSQVKEKIDQGFHCIKLKIGAIDFEEEISIIKSIRKEFSENEIEIRVDANGAFSPDDALEKLQRLADLNIHSIEQPIRQKQWPEMAELCSKSILPVALDEELIGINHREEKIKMLLSILPDYIILKPSLHGGFAGCNQWIELAESLNIGWWITSALESNIGLNAIAQWAATLNTTMPQGLGTGQLFTNNIPSPLEIKSGKLFYNPQQPWDLTLFS